jgi:hypothetical protein
VSGIGLWRCRVCGWVGYSVDGHCRQFDEHPDGPRIALESVEYVSAEQLQEALEALKQIRDHGTTNGHECWALHRGDCADVFQEIARATLHRFDEDGAS